MKERRGAKYGKFLADWINATIESISYPLTSEEYKLKFIKELKNYSFKRRKKGEQRNDGCVWELENIGNLNLSNPEHFARLVKEGIHLMYLKPTSERVIKSLLDNL